MGKNLINKIRIVILSFAAIALLGQFIFADTLLTGTVEGNVVITIEPSIIDFGVIPYGTNITHLGSDIIMNTTGSSTGGEIEIEISVTGDDAVFYDSLLELEEDGTSTWTDIGLLGTITMQDDSAKIFHTQLNGDTTVLGTGSKQAVLVYTIIAAIGSESKVTRTFSSTNVNQGEIVDVNLSVEINGGESYYAIEEYVPAGWTIIDDGGGATSITNKLAWAVIDSAADTTLTYSVQAPSQAGSYFFNGSYMFENFTVEETTLGETTIIVN